MIPKPMHAAEIAQRIGVTLDTFYKRRTRYHMIDGMPRPINSTGRPAYDRAGMEAWLTRFHPLRPAAPANDPLPHPAPAAIDEHRVLLARAYPPQKPAAAIDTPRRTARG